MSDSDDDIFAELERSALREAQISTTSILGDGYNTTKIDDSVLQSKSPALRPSKSPTSLRRSRSPCYKPDKTFVFKDIGVLVNVKKNKHNTFLLTYEISIDSREGSPKNVPTTSSIDCIVGNENELLEPLIYCVKSDGNLVANIDTKSIINIPKRILQLLLPESISPCYLICLNGAVHLLCDADEGGPTTCKLIVDIDEPILSVLAVCFPVSWVESSAGFHESVVVVGQRGRLLCIWAGSSPEIQLFSSLFCLPPVCIVDAVSVEKRTECNMCLLSGFPEFALWSIKFEGSSGDKPRVDCQWKQHGSFEMTQLVKRGEDWHLIDFYGNTMLVSMALHQVTSSTVVSDRCRPLLDQMKLLATRSTSLASQNRTLDMLLEQMNTACHLKRISTNQLLSLLPTRVIITPIGPCYNLIIEIDNHLDVHLLDHTWQLVVTLKPNNSFSSNFSRIHTFIKPFKALTNGCCERIVVENFLSLFESSEELDLLFVVQIELLFTPRDISSDNTTLLSKALPPIRINLHQRQITIIDFLHGMQTTTSSMGLTDTMYLSAHSCALDLAQSIWTCGVTPLTDSAREYYLTLKLKDKMFLYLTDSLKVLEPLKTDEGGFSPLVLALMQRRDTITFTKTISASLDSGRIIELHLSTGCLLSGILIWLNLHHQIMLKKKKPFKSIVRDKAKQDMVHLQCAKWSLIPLQDKKHIETKELGNIVQTLLDVCCLTRSLWCFQ